MKYQEIDVKAPTYSSSPGTNAINRGCYRVFSGNYELI
jgi:hypothetical protein